MSEAILKQKPSDYIAFTRGTDIYIPGYYSPLFFLIYLLHESGHVIDNARCFSSSKVLRPFEVNQYPLTLNSELKAELAQLLVTTKPDKQDWHHTITQAAFSTLEPLTKGHFNPNMINLHVMPTANEFGLSMQNVSLPVDVLSEQVFRKEIPAYYVQRAGLTMLGNSMINSFAQHLTHYDKNIGFLSHAAAYTSIEELFKGNAFPTNRIVEKKWRQRSRLVLQNPAPEYFLDFAQIGH